jgi:hypothetical protein
MNARIAHDVAFMTALDILEIFSPLLRDEEKRDAFNEVFARVKAGLESYDHEVKSLLHRLRPLQN